MLCTETALKITLCCLRVSTAVTRWQSILFAFVEFVSLFGLWVQFNPRKKIIELSGSTLSIQTGMPQICDWSHELCHVWIMKIDKNHLLEYWKAHQGNFLTSRKCRGIEKVGNSFKLYSFFIKAKMCPKKHTSKPNALQNLVKRDPKPQVKKT